MEFCRKAFSICLAALCSVVVVSAVVWASLSSLNQPGGLHCTAELWIYGSSLNAAGDAIPSCFPQFTNGSVLFSGTVDSSSGGVTQDNSNFFWSLGSHRLGIGTTSPGTALDVNGDITDRSIAGCSGGGQVVTTDGSGKFVCHTMTCSIGAPTCGCSCSASGGCSCSCTVGAASCTLN